jgi:hypothetical protein
MRNLLEAGFTGPIMPVNPKHQSVAGLATLTWQACRRCPIWQHRNLVFVRPIGLCQLPSYLLFPAPEVSFVLFECNADGDIACRNDGCPTRRGGGADIAACRDAAVVSRHQGVWLDLFFFLRTRLGVRWMLGVLGKGNKLRRVPMPSLVMAELQAYLAARGLNPDPMHCPAHTPLIARLRSDGNSETTGGTTLTASALYKLLKAFFAGADAKTARATRGRQAARPGEHTLASP